MFKWISYAFLLLSLIACRTLFILKPLLSGGCVVSRCSRVVTSGGCVVSRCSRVDTSGGCVVSRCSRVDTSGGCVVSRCSRVVTSGGCVVTRGVPSVVKCVSQITLWNTAEYIGVFVHP
jgi:hypothetical protein